MSQRVEPFALQLLRRHRNGESIEALAVGLGIPVDRVEMRLRVAAMLYEQQSAASAAPKTTEPAKQRDCDDRIIMTGLGLHI